MTYNGSTWTFGPDTPVDELRDDRRQAVDREQNALKAMESADPAFAKAITAKLVPDRDRNPDVIRRSP